MPPKKKSILLMVSNVGVTSTELNSIEDEPFIDKAKYAMRIIVEKKLYLQPKDEIGLITMGDETNNSEDMDYVRTYHDNLLIPNWEMIKYINDLSPTDHPCNWIEALHVALCFLKREVVEPDLRVFLVIFNNFKEENEAICNYDSEFIIKDLRSIENLHLLFVGENPLNDDSYQSSASPSEKYALKFINKGAAQYEQINDFVDARRFYIAPPVNAVPWKFYLEIADMAIPCASYIKVTDTVKTDSWKMKSMNKTQSLLTGSTSADISNLENNSSRVVRENIKLDQHRNEIATDEIINGYKFGGKYIPVSDDDEMAMKFGGTQKGMMVYGFAHQDEVKLEYWSGDGSRIIVPASEEDAEAFYSLLQAMVDGNYVAIVRKVYAANNLPKMGVLFPKIDDDNIWCLVHLELPFIEDIRIIEKIPIKSIDKIVDKEKLEALDNFIDAMTVKENELPYLNAGLFPNVKNQYHWNAFTDRALHPENPLLPVNDYLQKYLTPSEELVMKAKPHLEKLNKLFGVFETNKVSDKEKNSAQEIVQSSKPKEVEIEKTSENSSANKNSKETDEGFFSPDDLDTGMDVDGLDDI